MINKSYVKRGTKRIPEEILNMKILPNNFKELYLNAPFATNNNEIKKVSKILLERIEELLDKQNIVCELEKEEIPIEHIKEKISSEALTGTYEEIYSNYKNKMYHAANTNNVYLSFVTMSACQEFYDEMSADYEIPEIDLIGQYNPNDLIHNQQAFDKALLEWKSLYDIFNKSIIEFTSIEELNELYKKHI